ncbi:MULTISPECIES: alpha-(1-_3)-arabinofuranosyltransferase domain-containing protein [unclassified Nocardioides]|uniref:alpha-(1->3)-arabinofuranosyltransferase domain-containing protein n=1 Tax=unclassified Nocardioides TaxID=2615069 RepID=UPI00360B557A
MTEPSAPDRFAWRFRLVACCLVLVAIAFSQRPGRIFGDTKLDLVIDPGGLLARSLHLWDPEGSFGQVQNQGYGYLFPMGPFYWLGHLLDLPGWVIQRMWWSLLLVVAFLGIVKLCGALGIGSPVSRIVAGFAFALSPRIVTVLGPISIEAWPSALAPWVLVPLVIGAGRGSPRRAALLSALAVAAVGGVNAAATFAVIPLGAVWLLTRRPGPRRRSMMLWWPVFVLAATAWWLVPLFLLGRYSPPFLDYIETAGVTTFPTTVFDALRGTSHWVPYVDATWQAGNDLITTGYVAINSAALLLFGVAGLTMRRNPHRQFLVLSVLLGLLMVTAGHGGQLAGWFAGTERDALDGLLAPLRNVHKFDPIIRIPLVLGLAHLIAVLAARAREVGARDRSTRSDAIGDRLAYVGVLLLSIASVAGIAAPAFAGRLGTANDFVELPGYWYQTASWLDEHDDDTTALLVPGSSFGFYVWGDPDDEPMQPLASTPWAIRNAVPLAPAGNIRMLDAIEEQLASGRPSAGLAGYLTRAGIGHLVVRNDLRGTDQTPPVLVHQVLDGSPGLRKVADFGPYVGSRAKVGSDRDATVVDDGWTARYPAVEIYAVDGAHRAVASTGGPLVVGGPEDLLDLLDTRLIGDAPAVLATDAPGDVDSSDLVLTDGLRRQERNFARINDATSATLAEDDDGRRGAPARDYTIGDPRWETHAQILGAKAVSASSSQAYADSNGPVVTERLPFAAFDGLTATQWESDVEDRQPSVSVELEEPLDVDSVVVTAGDTGLEEPEHIRVVTDAGSSDAVEAPAGEPVTVAVPAGPTSSVTVIRDRRAQGPLAIAEVGVAGVDVDRTLVLPRVPADWGAPRSILLSATSGWREACVTVHGTVHCSPDRARSGEEPGALDRTVRLGAGASYEVTAEVAPTNGPALQGLIQSEQVINIRSSSEAVDDARGSAVAAVDGDRGTTWVADPDDETPSLSLDWLGERTVRGIDVRLGREAAASRVTRVVLEYPGGRQAVKIDVTGHARVETFRADRVDLYFESKRPADGLGPDGSREPLPVGVSELSLHGVGLLPITLSDTPTDLGCDFGPTVRAGDAFHATSVTASPRQLFDGGLLPARVCGPDELDVEAGDTRVLLSPAPAFRGMRLLMTRSQPPVPTVTPAQLTDESPVARELTLPEPGSSIAAIRENQNPGWVGSTPDDGTIDSVTIDGWQQGWRVDGDVTQVDLRFAPDRLYRGALAVGGSLLVLMVALGIAWRRARSSAPPVEGRSLPAVLVGACGLATYGVIGGWWAFVAGGAAMVLTAVTVDRWLTRDVAAWLSGLLVGSAGIFYWWRPLGSADGWAGTLVAPQLMVLAGLGVLVALSLDGDRSNRRFQRRAGRSTTR